MTRVFIVARSDRRRAALRDRCVAAGLTVIGESAQWSDVPPAETAVVIGWDEDDVTALEVSGDSTAPAILLLGDDRSALRRAASTGVQGWGLVPTTASPGELTAAVNAVAQGLVVAPAALMAEAVSAAEPEPGALQEPLTAREREVLELVGQGHSNRGIAQTLGISDHTVKFHLASIYGKLGVSTRTGAVRRGLRRGLITI